MKDLFSNVSKENYWLLEQLCCHGDTTNEQFAAPYKIPNEVVTEIGVNLPGRSTKSQAPF